MKQEISYFEKLTRRFFKAILKNQKLDFKPKYNLRPQWLKNPKTGRCLELDIYYPDLKFAIEVQGFQHKLDYQKYKDEVK